MIAGLNTGMHWTYSHAAANLFQLVPSAGCALWCCVVGSLHNRLHSLCSRDTACAVRDCRAVRTSVQMSKEMWDFDRAVGPVSCSPHTDRTRKGIASLAGMAAGAQGNAVCTHSRVLPPAPATRRRPRNPPPPQLPPNRNRTHTLPWEPQEHRATPSRLYFEKAVDGWADTPPPLPSALPPRSAFHMRPIPMSR